MTLVHSSYVDLIGGTSALAATLLVFGLVGSLNLEHKNNNYV